MAETKHLQWQAEVIVGAPLEKTWAVFDDLSLIPRYHPVVRSVELLSGMSRRASGVEYKCIVPTGSRRGWCIEKVIDHVPLRSSTVAFTDDSWGLSKLVSDFVTEVSVERSGGAMTRVVLRGFYTPKGWWGALLNALFIRRNMRTRAADTLQGAKQLLESTPSSEGQPAEPFYGLPKSIDGR
jgi:uncharacterized membrane protein